MIQVKNLPPPDDLQPIHQALLSVSDKAGLVPFAQRLHALNIRLLSTGGTAKTLREAGLPVTDVSDVTGFPEIMDGRVKTLHPNVHGGLLARRNDPNDLAQLAEIGGAPIDLVVVNLYPFAQATSAPDVTDAVAIENIDIGGPTMIRSAAKNFFFVSILTSANDYSAIADELEAQNGALCMATRRRLAHQAFAHTAAYDAMIDAYFARSTENSASASEDFAQKLPLAQSLRYGENPHQNAALYGNPSEFFTQLHGKELSFNNILDLSAALSLIDEFRNAAPTCAILKHTNPCGVGTAETLEGAWEKAFATDRQSPFGGIVIVNRSLDLASAKAMDRIFTEVIIAPDFEEGVLDLLKKKANRRLIKMEKWASESSAPDVRSVLGGALVQDRDAALPTAEALRGSCTIATKRVPTETEWNDLDFAWRVAKHVKSNAIVYAKNGGTLGIGAGQMSRIDASEIAVSKGQKESADFSGCVVASDAFFPFADGLLAAASAGASAVIQPGGSIRDEEVIEAANIQNLAMVFTGKRHFRH
jgi:phosphoribosylaminoimidazolecarboxamide formyltransferase/IMP cyclohydrolase